MHCLAPTRVAASPAALCFSHFLLFYCEILLEFNKVAKKDSFQYSQMHREDMNNYLQEGYITVSQSVCLSKITQKGMQRL